MKKLYITSIIIVFLLVITTFFLDKSGAVSVTVHVVLVCVMLIHYYLVDKYDMLENLELESYKKRKIGILLDFSIYKKWKEVNFLFLNNEEDEKALELFRDIDLCINNDTINNTEFIVVFDIYKEFLQDCDIEELKKSDIISDKKRKKVLRKINEMNQYLYMSIKKEVDIIENNYQEDEYREINELLAIYKDKYQKK